MLFKLSEFPRIPLPRTPLNKGKKKGRELSRNPGPSFWQATYSLLLPM